MDTQALGRHLLIEFYGCSRAVLNDEAAIREVMLEAARRAKATIVAEVFHRFSPQGVSGVVVIAESHVAIHSWPEFGCASVDIFSCSDRMTPEAIVEFLKGCFRADRVEVKVMERGRVPV